MSHEWVEARFDHLPGLPPYLMRNFASRATFGVSISFIRTIKFLIGNGQFPDRQSAVILLSRR
jgi:hypothetical protein